MQCCGINLQLHKQLISIDNHTKMEKEESRKGVTVYCVILSISGFFLGWDVGTAGYLINERFQQVYRANTLMMGLVILSFNLGCLIGCIGVCQVCTWAIGYNGTFRVGSLIYIIGSVIQLVIFIISGNQYIFILGRLSCGICCGMLCLLGPIYMSHLIIDSAKKGYYLSFCQIVVCLSILAGNIANYTTYPVIYGIQIGMAVIINGLLFFVPESPQYYLQHKKYFAIKQIFTKLTNDENKAMEFIKQESMKKLVDKFEMGRMWKCCLIMIFQQLTGINYFFYFGGIISQSFLQTPSRIPMIIMSVINLIGSVVGTRLISKYDPITILKLSSMVMIMLLISYLILGEFIETHPAIGISLLITSCLYIFLFAISWGPCSGVLNNEISQDNQRIMGLSIGTNWFTNFLIGTISPTLIEKLSFNYGIIFAIFISILIFFIRKIS